MVDTAPEGGHQVPAQADPAPAQPEPPPRRERRRGHSDPQTTDLQNFQASENYSTTTVETTPGNSVNAVDQAVLGLRAEYLRDPGRNWEAAAPLGMALAITARGGEDASGKAAGIAGAAKGLAKGAAPTEGLVSKLIKNFKNAGPANTAANIAQRAGDMAGVGTQVADATREILAPGVTAAVGMGVLSPLIAGVQRLRGEKAWTLAAKMFQNKDTAGFWKRILYGGKSWAAKKGFFHESREFKKMLQMAENGPPDITMIGGRDKLIKLMGVAAAKQTLSDMVIASGAQLSEHDRRQLNRWGAAYKLAKQMYDNIPDITDAEKARIASVTLPKIIMSEEAKTWGRMRAYLALENVAEAATYASTLTGTFRAMRMENIQAVAKLAGNAVKQFGGWVKDVAGVLSATTADIGKWVNTHFFAGSIPHPDKSLQVINGNPMRHVRGGWIPAD